MEILVVVGLITFLAVYAGLEMSRKTKESDIVRIRTHLTYITAALDRYYGATKDLTGVSSMSVLCDGNYLLRSICTGSATNAAKGGSGGFSGISIDPVYTVVGTNTATATVTVDVGDTSIASFLKQSLDTDPIQGTSTDALNSKKVRFTFTPTPAEEKENE